MTPAEQLAAARHFAPPLFITMQADRRGARLRTVNRRAVDYASRAGLALDQVYPGCARAIAALAPAPGAPEAPSFEAAAGLPSGALAAPRASYPVAFGAERRGPPRRPAPAGFRWDWRWALVGAAFGAVLGGPVWAGVFGVVGGWR